MDKREMKTIEDIDYHRFLRVEIDNREHTLITIDEDEFVSCPVEIYRNDPDAYATCINDLYLFSRTKPTSTIELEDVEQFFANYQPYPGLKYSANTILDFIGNNDARDEELHQYIQAICLDSLSEALIISRDLARCLFAIEEKLHNTQVALDKARAEQNEQEVASKKDELSGLKAEYEDIHEQLSASCEIVDAARVERGLIDKDTKTLLVV